MYFRFIDSLLNFIFSVADTGVGIPEDKHETIFKAFEQTVVSASRTTKGTGLGLTISKRLVEAMNGRITVDSRENVGSTFTVVIENVAKAALGDAPPTKEDAFDPSSIVFEKAAILIVDDIEYNRDLLRGFLAESDFEVVEAKNGKEALVFCKSMRPDLIFLDMKMPVMDGYKVAEILMEDSATNEIPVVAVTASALVQDEVAIRKICADYLRKPVRKNDLIKTTMKYLPYKQVAKKADSTIIRMPAVSEKEIVLDNLPGELKKK